jgi:acyl-CoA synthetase (NDP forming)
MLSFILGAQYDLRFFCFGDDDGFELGHQDELLGLVKEQRFDLIMVYSYLRLPEERKVFASIKAQYGKPIIVSNMGALASSEAHEASIDVFLPMPFTLDNLRKALADCGVETHNGALRNHDKPLA